jgi:hypothetical protein
MIQKWVRLLPYFLVVRIAKMVNADFFEFQNRKVRGWQIDKGEFLIYDEENYKIHCEHERKRQQNKLDKRLERINKKLSKDWTLKEALKEELKEDDEDTFIGEDK